MIGGGEAGGTHAHIFTDIWFHAIWLHDAGHIKQSRGSNPRLLAVGPNAFIYAFVVDERRSTRCSDNMKMHSFGHIGVMQQTRFWCKRILLAIVPCVDQLESGVEKHIAQVAVRHFVTALKSAAMISQHAPRDRASILAEIPGTGTAHTQSGAKEYWSRLEEHKQSWIMFLTAAMLRRGDRYRPTKFRFQFHPPSFHQASNGGRHRCVHSVDVASSATMARTQATTQAE